MYYKGKIFCISCKENFVIPWRLWKKNQNMDS